MSVVEAADNNKDHQMNDDNNNNNDDDGSCSSSSVSLGDKAYIAESTTTTTTTTTTTITTSSSSTTTTISSSIRTITEGELFWLQLRRQWTTRRRVGDTPAQAAAHEQQRGAGVLKSINGGVALDDFLCARPRLSERISLADMVSLLHDIWEEDANTL